MFYTYSLYLIVRVFNGGIKKIEVKLPQRLVLCEICSVCAILINKGARGNSLDVR